MVHLVKRRQRGLISPGNGSNRTLDSSSGHIATTPKHEKSPSNSSLRSTNSSHRKPSSHVCFACDYGSPDQVSESPPPLSFREFQDAFYTKDDLNRFDKDRALTVLMYRTRKPNGVAWNDNVNSLRGLEDALRLTKRRRPSHTSSTSSPSSPCSTTGASSKDDCRRELIHAVLREQDRLKSPSGRRDLAAAALTIRKSERELYEELIRGVSCSMSRNDKQKAIQLAQKDEESAGHIRNRSNSRRMLSALKTKLYHWVSTSNGSMAESVAGSVDSGYSRTDDSTGNGGCSFDHMSDHSHRSTD